MGSDVDGGEGGAPGSRPLLDWLGDRHPESPRKRLKSWIAAGRVFLDGNPVRTPQLRMTDPGARLTLGTREEGRLAPREPAETVSGIPVVFADESLLIVDKPVGLLSVPARDGRERSAEEWLRSAYGLRVRAVHRLDRDTSGLLCFARTEWSHEDLVRQVRSRELGREYVAYCSGWPECDEGVWEDFLRLTESGRQVCCEARARGATRATTTFRTLARLETREGRFAQLHLSLHSGLKHQIRIQATSRGLPLVGDVLYGEPAPARTRVSRMALHAWKLRLRHPQSGEEIEFVSPWPRELKRLRSVLERG